MEVVSGANRAYVLDDVGVVELLQQRNLLLQRDELIFVEVAQGDAFGRDDFSGFRVDGLEDFACGAATDATSESVFVVNHVTALEAFRGTARKDHVGRRASGGRRIGVRRARCFVLKAYVKMN